MALKLLYILESVILKYLEGKMKKCKPLRITLTMLCKSHNNITPNTNYFE